MGEKETREGGGREEARDGKEAARGGETERVFVNAHKYTCLAIFNMAMVHTSL